MKNVLVKLNYLFERYFFCNGYATDFIDSGKNRYFDKLYVTKKVYDNLN